MKIRFKKICLIFSLLFSIGCSNVTKSSTKLFVDIESDQKDTVALYIHEYGKLPKNYMTKKEARKYGWTSGALSVILPGNSIGGDRYGNYEETLPSDDMYFERDIDTDHSKSRGSKRIVFSNDGDIYYTDDHYDTFQQLYKGN